MWKRIKEIFGQTIVQLLVTGVLAVIGWILASSAALPAYQILLLLIILIGFTFWGINQIDILRQKRKKTLTKLSDKEIENTIREWIDIPAFKFQRLETISDVYFGFEVTFGNSPVHIERQYKDPLVIVLASELQMRPEKTVLTNAQWERLASRLAIEMARLGIQFQFRGSPNVWETLRVIDTVILDDSMTGFYFRQRVMFVYRAILLASEVFKECLRQMFETPIPDTGDSQT